MYAMQDGQYSQQWQDKGPISGGGLGIEHYSAGIVFGALLFLWFVGKGYRSLGVPGTNVRVG